MCGILGIISRDKKICENYSKKSLLNSIAHRGPDSQDSVKGKNFYFGHSRLSIIGLKEGGAKQPIYKKNKILVFNGEIYNYKDLSNELNENGYYDSGKSDTETLFNFIFHYGLKKTISKIDGMYAFGYFDLDKEELSLVRDRIGEKPLYYSTGSNYFTFSSEIKSIFNSNLNNFSPNIDMFHEIFLHGKILGKKTAFKNIYEIEPGTFLKYKLRNQSYKIYDYWKLDNFDVLKQDVSMEEFEDKFNNCIKSRLTSDVPIASLVSGGIDSSSLVYKMLQLGNQNAIKLFFAENINQKINEKKQVDFYFNFLRKKFKEKDIQLFSIKNEIKDYWNNLEKVAYYNDEPCTFNNFHLVYSLSKNIRKNKIKVIFSGEGADEIFFGYDRFKRTNDLFLPGKTNANLENIYYGASIKDIKITNKILNTNSVKSKVLSSAPWGYLNEVRKKFDLNTAQMLFSQKYRMQALLQRQDRAAMAFGVESRAPFLRPSFVRWINSIKFSQKYEKKSQQGKYLLKNYMSKYLDKKIINRKKKGFGNDFDLELNKKYAIDKVRELVDNQNSITSNYFNKKEIIKILDSKKEIDKNKTLIRKILNAEIWFNVFFNKKKLI